MSTQATHTPGPWKEKRKLAIYSADDEPICTVFPAETEGQSAADARLISAAPEMLDALRVTLHRAEQARHSSEQLGPIAAEWLDGIITEARQAIAKAEGRAGE